MYDKLDRWTFGIDTDKLVSLVLEGKKTATTSLYETEVVKLHLQKSWPKKKAII